jgi:hypothetical protein
MLETDENSGQQDIYLKKTVSKVTELFSGKIIAENTDCFSYRFSSPDTVLFYLE